MWDAIKAFFGIDRPITQHYVILRDSTLPNTAKIVFGDYVECNIGGIKKVLKATNTQPRTFNQLIKDKTYTILNEQI